MEKRVKPSSFHLQWHITERCNFNCRHCYRRDYERELSTKDLFLVLDQYIELIRAWELDKYNRPRKLSISGGEPLLRGDIFELLRKIKRNRELFTSIVLMSNGSTITRVTAKRLKDYAISAVQISLEGTENVNDNIRGKGSFEKALKGVENLMNAGIPVGVSITVSKENHADVENLIDLLVEKGVKYIGVSRYVPMGNDSTIRILEPRELRDFFFRIMKERRELLGRNVYLSTHCSDSLWFIEDENHETHGCSAGYDSFSILPNGDVVPCRRLPIKVGNVLEKTLMDMWYTSDFLWKLRDKGNIKKCNQCELFRLCFGGARCIAYGYFGDPFAPDPQCWKLFRSLPDKSMNFETGAKKKVLNEAYLRRFKAQRYFEHMVNV